MRTLIYRAGVAVLRAVFWLLLVTALLVAMLAVATVVAVLTFAVLMATFGPTTDGMPLLATPLLTTVVLTVAVMATAVLISHHRTPGEPTHDARHTAQGTRRNDHVGRRGAGRHHRGLRGGVRLRRATRRRAADRDAADRPGPDGHERRGDDDRSPAPGPALGVRGLGEPQRPPTGELVLASARTGVR